MSIIEQIKTEIERLKEHTSKCGYPGQDEYADGNKEGRNFICDKLLSFLSTLESEKPIIPNDRDEAAKEYAKTTFKKPYSDNPDEEVTIVEPDKYAGFIAGAKWDREQMMKEAVEGWVATDSDTDGKRRVTFFSQKPVRDVLTEYKYWAATRPRYESIKLDSNAFPELKWEDEPKKVRFIIVKGD